MAFGVYVHVPFCAARCDYCDFATWTDRAHLVQAYVDACATDVRRRALRCELPPASSIFFGGGTPSLLTPEQLSTIVREIPRAPGAEVTAECNPDSVADLVAIRTASLDNPSWFNQQIDVWTCDAHPWDQMNPALPKFEKYPPSGD